MRHRTRPLPCDRATRAALQEGCEDRRLHPRRRQHYRVLLLRVRGKPVPVIAQDPDIELKEAALYKLVTRFKKEGLSFLEHPYRHPHPGHKRPGPAPTLTDKQLRQLSRDDDVLEGALAGVQRWIGVETGKTVSLKTASRWRLKAEKLHEKG